MDLTHFGNQIAAHHPTLEQLRILHQHDWVVVKEGTPPSCLLPGGPLRRLVMPLMLGGPTLRVPASVTHLALQLGVLPMSVEWTRRARRHLREQMGEHWLPQLRELEVVDHPCSPRQVSAMDVVLGALIDLGEEGLERLEVLRLSGPRCYPTALRALRNRLPLQLSGLKVLDLNFWHIPPPVVRWSSSPPLQLLKSSDLPQQFGIPDHDVVFNHQEEEQHLEDVHKQHQHQSEPLGEMEGPLVPVVVPDEAGQDAKQH